MLLVSILIQVLRTLFFYSEVLHVWLSLEMDFKLWWISIPLTLPIVSIVVPFWGLPYRILHKKLVKPKKGTTMETIGKPQTGFKPNCESRGFGEDRLNRRLPQREGHHKKDR